VKFRACLVAFLLVSLVNGQNLVPNYNFEEFSLNSIPNCCGAIGSQDHNLAAAISNRCARDWDVGLGFSGWGVVRSCFEPPLETNGSIMPISHYGNALAHLLSGARTTGGDFNERFLNVQLVQPLSPNQTYCVEFFLRPSPISTVTTINPGVFFTDSIVNALLIRGLKFINPPVIPQVFFPGKRVNNVNQWEHYKAAFVAQGGEQYLTFGSFIHITDSDQVFQPHQQVTGPWSPLTTWSNIAYWLVDAILCYKCSDTLFTVHIGRDTLLCPGESVALHAHYEGFKLQDTSVVFNWQTPAGPRADSTVVANTPGYYEVEVVINHRFRARHGVWVHFGPEPPTQDRYLPETIELCEGHDTVLALPNWDTTAYQWSTGTTGPSLRVALPGTYTVVVENFCWDHEESVTVTEKLCDQRMWIPNAFSPNGDGINDRFEIRGTWQTPIALWIFDRWGNVVFHSEAYQNDWAGTLPNGQPAMPGVYTWKIAYRNTPTSGEREKHGTVVIVP
jgi:gliding motility-associated-like protein